MALTGLEDSDTAAALRRLLIESFRRWEPDAVPQCDEHAHRETLTFKRGGAIWIRIQRIHGPEPFRWTVETVQPDARTSRNHFGCTSVLHVLRVVRQLADSGFDPLTRARMGAPGPSA